MKISRRDITKSTQLHVDMAAHMGVFTFCRHYSRTYNVDSMPLHGKKKQIAF